MCILNSIHICMFVHLNLLKPYSYLQVYTLEHQCLTKLLILECLALIFGLKITISFY